eukprot:gnl/MRDRNA2_/MRDRNA2_82266_c0_seq1.p1 gnl/MRDRNA2_/MRDRNA2_82266_c0~~gnl/MRDRNA2_/MRDRNA2_82266_c0_seq1.p1  ORF type:complete len:216 (-),score=36.59 gnl/MRDRNA2_/MRDRNA2_82266_c0_seq1:93-740(-)
MLVFLLLSLSCSSGAGKKDNPLNLHILMTVKDDGEVAQSFGNGDAVGVLNHSVGDTRKSPSAQGKGALTSFINASFSTVATVGKHINLDETSLAAEDNGTLTSLINASFSTVGKRDFDGTSPAVQDDHTSFINASSAAFGNQKQLATTKGMTQDDGTHSTDSTNSNAHCTGSLVFTKKGDPCNVLVTWCCPGSQCTHRKLWSRSNTQWVESWTCL